MNLVLVVLLSFFSYGKDVKNESLRPENTVPQQPTPSGTVDLNQYKDVHLKKKNDPNEAKNVCITPGGTAIEQGAAGYDSCLDEVNRFNSVRTHDTGSGIGTSSGVSYKPTH